MKQNGSKKITFDASLSIISGILISLFLMLSWGNSLIHHASIDQQIQSFQEENDQVKKENKKLFENFQYLQSPQYRDKWAKEHRGLAQPREKVLIIEMESPEEYSEIEDQKILEREFLLSRPNREQWRILFFPTQK